MITVSCDLHIHSCLSPCSDALMTPANIANMAALAGVEVIAVSDHNTCGNCAAVLRAARRAGLLALPAMELTTAEEIHVLCLLPDMDSAGELQRRVYASLPPIENRPDIYGEQVLMDDADGIVGCEPRLLAVASGLDIYSLDSLLRSLGGIAIPAHIDRTSFSLLATLGDYDPLMGFRTIEISKRADHAALLERYASLAGLRVIRNSDAHALDMMEGAEFTLAVETADAAGVIRALHSGRDEEGT